MQCPKCNVEMDEVRKLDVIIDSCSRCGGIWLDKGELEKIRAESNKHRRDYQQGYHQDKRYDKHYDKHYDDNYYSGKRKKKKGIFDIFEIFD